ncbi:nicastrin-like [Babylonia areolata]|uniref:nicastrin-like n=1 Tax=Babylonia areolata TaxID=304850 RepID=UPI003FD5FA05
MAARRVLLCVALQLVFCFSSVHVSGEKAKRTKEKIYIDMLSQNSCFRLLNATHQVGCSSAQEGNTGVVHYMQTEEDWTFVLTTGPTPPYVPVLETVNFTLENVRNLTQSGRVNGIVVISVNLTSDLFQEKGGFSVDSSCPNDAYGYYKNTEEEGCKRLQWNPAGNGFMFENLGVPIFSLTEQSDVNTVLNKCWERFNKPIGGVARTYPLCAIQLVSAMTAAKDTQTCVRRSNLITNLNPFVFCDPLGDKNVVTTLKALPNNETRPEKSVIVVATRMDSMSLFHNEYPSSDSTVTGIVTLLATAKALWSVRDALGPDDKDVMFTFFQGEAFDYIGSSRMLYEMQAGRFPVNFNAKSRMRYVQKINLTHIAQFVELSQVGMRQDEDSLWLHVDPSVWNDTKNLTDKLTEFGAASSTRFQESDVSLPLPPASLQRFLMAMGNETLPSFVVTDHKHSFTNRYYNSRLDLPAQIQADYDSDLNETEWYNANTTQSRRITALATALARYLFWAATSREPNPEQRDKLTAEIEEVNHMLYCFLHSPHCELFNATIGPDNADVLKKNKKPYPFYVSVSHHTNEVTSLVSQVLTYYTGQQVVNATKNTCKITDTDWRYRYLWMQGSMTSPGGRRKPVCYRSTVLLTTAKSPAFEIDDYDWESGQYSTWTESRWDSFKLRVFLIPSKQFETRVLATGVVILIVSLVFVYFLSARADFLFDRRSVYREFLVEVDT